MQQQTAKVLAELHKTQEPVLITEYGKPSAYIISVEDYEQMQNRMQILEGIAKGEMAILQNNIYTHEEAKEKMKKWLD